MFTVKQIEDAHSKVKSGADFPAYIREIKQLGVLGFETWVCDSHSEYFGANNYRAVSEPQYALLLIADQSDKELFAHYLKIHQQGQTDYITFCNHSAQCGIEKWVVQFNEMTCTYYDKHGKMVVAEKIPS